MSRHAILVSVLAASSASLALSPPAGAQTSVPATGASGPSGLQPAAAAARPRHQGLPKAHLTVRVKGDGDHRLPVDSRLRAIGRIKPFVPGQNVKLRVLRDGHQIKARKYAVTQIRHTGVGRFHVKTSKLTSPGPYVVIAHHRRTLHQGYGKTASSRVGIRYPDLSSGEHSKYVKIFEHLLAHMGYYTPHGRTYGDALGLSVLAFRKVNGMARTTDATPGIFRNLAKGKGGFNLEYPGAGRHVEVDISRQVMVLADHGKAQYILHVSTGAPATPTITGHYHFYRRDPGYNSLGMYYSVYWSGGYAIHGYHDVPTYNASHGCVREPIADAVFAYNWVRLGESIYTYN